MNKEALSKRLLAALLDFEKSDDLVITSRSPSDIADRLSSIVVQWCATEVAQWPPPTQVIDESLSNARGILSTRFDLNSSDASIATDRFFAHLSEGRTIEQIAELMLHQSDGEIALGAYFCGHAQRGDYYGPAYLDWRKVYNQTGKIG